MCMTQKNKDNIFLILKFCLNISETTDVSIASTEEFVKDIQKLETDLVEPTITPRFALSCSKQLMTKLGEIAHKNNLHIQVNIGPISKQNLYMNVRSGFKILMFIKNLYTFLESY